MQLITKRFFIITILVFSFFFKANFLLAEDNKPLYPGFTPPAESKAYDQFLLRPQSDLSKLIYLIDRFVDSDIQVMYENHYYPAFFAARVARAFLPGHYKNETPQTWIMQWCSTSFPSGAPIWMKFSDGNYKLSREVLIQELKLLDQALQEESVKKKDWI